jgi:hypothetical protein
MERSRPLDALGNELRRGDLVRVTLQSPALTFRIVELESAGVIESPGGGMPLQGMMMLVATMPVPFSGGMQFTDMFKLVDPQPEQTRAQMDGGTLGLVKQ